MRRKLRKKNSRRTQGRQLRSVNSKTFAHFPIKPIHRNRMKFLPRGPPYHQFSGLGIAIPSAVLWMVNHRGNRRFSIVHIFSGQRWQRLTLHRSLPKNFPWSNVEFCFPNRFDQAPRLATLVHKTTVLGRQVRQRALRAQNLLSTPHPRLERRVQNLRGSSG